MSVKQDVMIRYLTDAIDYMDFAPDRAASNIRRVINWLEADRDGGAEDEEASFWREHQTGY